MTANRVVAFYDGIISRACANLVHFWEHKVKEVF